MSSFFFVQFILSFSQYTEIYETNKYISTKNEYLSVCYLKRQLPFFLAVAKICMLQRCLLLIKNFFGRLMLKTYLKLDEYVILNNIWNNLHFLDF